MIAFALFLLFPAAAAATPQASSLTGDWTTPNHSVVRVFACDGEHLCARVVTVGPKDKPQNDANNPDSSLRSRGICGLTIGTAFTPEGAQQAKNGKIYDPESGKTYSATMQTSGDQLNLRGFIGFSLLGRTETWQRSTTPVAECR